MTRIIGGTFKSRQIRAPKNLPIRPTTDFAKEGLFNILDQQINYAQISVLDVFAGSGNIAYEFFSRGTQNITCVDQSFRCTRFIKKTFQTIFNHQHPLVVCSEAEKFLQKTPNYYDLIFADPPYNYSNYSLLIKRALIKLNTQGILVLEHSKEHDFSMTDRFIKHKKYGHVHFSFFNQS